MAYSAILIRETFSKSSVVVFNELKNVSLSGFARREKNTLHKLIREVNLLEHEADVVERESAAFVFSEGDDNPLAAMHMYRVLQRMDDVANACEMAANAFLPLVFY